MLRLSCTFLLYTQNRKGEKDCTGHTHRLKTKWYAHMWIRACVCVCVRGQLYLCAATISTGRVGWWQLDRWQGWRGGGLVLHGQPQFQLNQGLTLIPALHTAAHEAECGVRQSLTEDASATLRVTCHRGFTARSARRVRVGVWISACDVAPCKPSPNIRPCVKGKMDYICIAIVIFSLAEIITLKTRHNLFDFTTRCADEDNAGWWSVPWR